VASEKSKHVGDWVLLRVGEFNSKKTLALPRPQASSALNHTQHSPVDDPYLVMIDLHVRVRSMLGIPRNVFICSLGLLLAPLGKSAAATVTVINLGDAGAGSLRQQIATASDGDTIVFTNGLSGTITLTSGELAVNKNLTISGP